MTIGACARPDQLMSAARSWVSPVVAARGGRPGKNEQPRTPSGSTPPAIMSPGRSDSCTQIRQGDPAHRFVPSSAREALP
jgi:hypothetical protein